MRLLPSRIRIPILLTILFNIHVSLSLLYYTKKIEKREITEKKTRCLQVAIEKLFLSSENLYIVGNDNEDNSDIYRILYKNFTFIRESIANFESKSVKRYIIIEDDILPIMNIFQKSDFSKWSEYLILTRTSFENLSGLATYLYKLEFFYVGFLLVGDEGNVPVYQFDARPSDINNIILTKTADCDDYFLMNRKVQKSLRPFNQILCPKRGCVLNFWRLITDTPNSIAYEVEENGTSYTDSSSTRILQLFSEHHQIRMTKKMNDTNVDVSWKDAAKAVLNGTVDVLYGFTIPEAEDVESIAIIVALRFVSGPKEFLKIFKISVVTPC